MSWFVYPDCKYSLFAHNVMSQPLPLPGRLWAFVGLVLVSIRFRHHVIYVMFSICEYWYCCVVCL
jgi:hypothetical protein